MLLRVGEHRYYVFGPYAPKDDGDEAEAEEADEDTKYGFSPKQAIPIKGILHPSLLEGDDDVKTDLIGDAMKKGKPLFADGSGGAATSAGAAKKSKPAPKIVKKPAAKKSAAKKPAAKKSAAKKPAVRKPAAKQKSKQKKR